MTLCLSIGGCPSGNQVTPFTLATPDGESIYAWHIVPLPLYLRNEARFINQTCGLVKDPAESESLRLLKEDAEAKLVLYCKYIDQPLERSLRAWRCPRPAF